MRTARLNWIAILLAAVACFLLEALWFTLWMNPWLEGTGRTREWLAANATLNPALQYGTAFVCSVIAAAALSSVVQATGEQTATRGALCGALMWLGFVATSWAKEYAFEERSLAIWAINTGVTLLELMVAGAILGGWKKRSALEA